MVGRGIALAALVAVTFAPVAAASEEGDSPETIRAQAVEIQPRDGSEVVVDGRRYAGRVRVSGHGSGIAVVETVDLDSYLAGIQEVPFSWEPAALEAQVIAARTYLAWNLARGRTESGRVHDYDICATDACQVYAGVEPVRAEGGGRWLDAVRSTDSEILLHDGEPAQAYYSSTSGGRTRTVSDVWPDVDLPYLEAVDSPGEESPFVEWGWMLPAPQMERLLAAAGLVSGQLEDVKTTVRQDGQGPWTVTIVSSEGEETVDTWSLRGILNRYGPAVHPTWLPAFRPDGVRYPQSILSPSYRIDSFRLGGGAPGGTTVYVVEGRGWGHLVGMSQYGAQAMAERGADAAEILAHFYGGLEPVEAPDHVPETVEVALALGRADFRVEVTGPVDVVVDGERVADQELGSWEMTADRGSIEVTTPVGMGMPPRLRGGMLRLRPGRMVFQPELTAAAEVTWRVTVDGGEVASFGPEPVDAGFLSIPVPIRPDVGVEIQATNAHGSSVMDLGGVSEEGH